MTEQAPAPRSARRRAAAVAALVLGVPIAQTLFVRWFDPWFTWTMVGVAWERRAEPAPLSKWQPKPLDELGPHVARAAVASEDGWFFQHHGFDCGQIRAAIDDARAGVRTRGASTITQQVAKNVFLWQTQSWPRKGLEVVYTVLLELLVPKERILELYVNVAQTGPGTFGFEAGAQAWFHKPAASLSWDEAARLVSILPSPRRWTPRDDHVQKRAAQLHGLRVPFPGEPGFDLMATRAPWCIPSLFDAG